jgi:putative hydrolase of the HAD superfamily
VASIKAVLFDADGVVQTSASFVDAIRRVVNWDVADAEAFLQELWRREEELGCLTGAGDLVVDLAGMLAERDMPHDAPEFYAAVLLSTIVPAGEVLALVDEVRASGVFCGLATNQVRPRLAFMVDDLGYGSRFDGIFASCDLGLRKPSREYFEAVLAAVQLPPADVLFLDDHPGNVAVARDVGLRAELVAGLDDVGRLLASHGLLRKH